MLKSNPELPLELPLVGSVGFLRGTAQRAMVVRRNPGTPRTCLVKLYDKVGLRFEEVRGASGNATVEEADLYPNEDLAWHAGRTARRSPARRAPRKQRRV